MGRPLHLLFLAAVIVAAKVKEPTEPKEPKVPTEPKEPKEPVEPKSHAKSETSEKKGTAGETVTFPTIGLFSESYHMCTEMLREAWLWSAFSTEYVRDAWSTVSGVAREAYTRVSTACAAHGPTMKTVVYDSLAAGEVYLMEAKSFTQTLYRENLGPHLDPHVAVVQDAYNVHAHEHVNAAYKVCSDAFPMLVKHAADACDVIKRSVGTAYSETNNHVLQSILPAVQIGAEKMFASAKDKTAFLLLPIKIRVGSKTVHFPYGAPDVAFAVCWLSFLIIASCVVLIKTISFVWRFVGKFFSVTKCLVKFVIRTAYLLIFTLMFGLIFFALRLVTLNYLCKCCGLCSKRKAAAKSCVPTKSTPTAVQSKKGVTSPSGKAAECKADSKAAAGAVDSKAAGTAADSKAATKKAADSKAAQQKQGKKK